MTIKKVKVFAKILKDFNPIHLDKKYALSSRYRSQIVHWLMTASLFSGLFGSKLSSEGCVYKSQNICFKTAIYVNDIITARAEVTLVNLKKKIIEFRTYCFADNKAVIDGETETSIH